MESWFSDVCTIPIFRGKPVPRSDVFYKIYDSAICAGAGIA
jgi:hypothetical protein